MSRNEPTKPRFPIGPRKSQAELDWEAARKIARDKSPHEWSVAPKCTVPQDAGPTLHAGDKVDPDRIEGGMPTVIRWMRDGYILQTDERRAKTNRREYDIVFVKSATHGGRIYDVGEGADEDELTVAAEEGYQTIGPNGRLIDRPGRPERPGSEVAEHLIERGLAERMKLTDKVRQAAKRVLKGSSKAAG